GGATLGAVRAMEAAGLLRFSVRSLLATKGAGCGLGIGDNSRVSTGFEVSMIAGDCGVVAMDVGLAVNGRTRAMGAGAEEATAL
ncbi:MAG TPA: hypothetical protein VFQ89_08305, partial [Candidatus Binatia bacterium]|nr:hypothetical protein [Candidatus Binatia bacterium]